MKLAKRNNEGFTLIELIMVIVILGILAATVVPKFFDFTTKAHESNKKAVLGAIKTGLHLYASNELVNGNDRKFPAGGTLDLTVIMDETPPAEWSVVNGTADDTIKYSGDGSSWLYSTTNNDKKYTITSLP